jgi:ABC-type multidrug transport system fused ATPase/permease subunit
MSGSIRAGVSAIMRLLKRLELPALPFLGSIGLLVAGGALEGGPVALLVPLLDSLTNSEMKSPPLMPALGHWLGGMSATQRVVVFGSAIVLLVVIKNLLMVAGYTWAGLQRSHVITELRRQLLDRVLGAPPVTLERNTSGAITDVFVSEAYRVNRIFESGGVLILRSVMALSYVVALLLLSWRFLALTLVLGFVLGFAALRIGRRVLGYGRNLSRASGDLARIVTEVVGGTRVIRTTASAEMHAKAFVGPNHAHARADFGASTALTVQTGVMETVGIVGAVSLTVIARIFWLGTGALDTAHFLAFGFGLVRLLPALNMVYATLGMLLGAVGALEHVLEWLDLPSYPVRPFGKRLVPPLHDGISFENVTLEYADGHAPFRNLSFAIPKGGTIAVLGPSGSGKSTLASVLLRLREPTTGCVRFDGVDHWEFQPRDFHRAVGFVDQDPFMFNTSIVDNVISGRPGITRANVEAAIGVVQLGDLIARLPQGLDTVLAERGSTLSGGQRQRLAIARAIVQNPDVLVLDEPTSALDPETEEEVVKAVDRASVGRTTIIITHRATTVRHATHRLDLGTGMLTVLEADQARGTSQRGEWAAVGASGGAAIAAFERAPKS